jgi:hypothetical protein
MPVFARRRRIAYVTARRGPGRHLNWDVYVLRGAEEKQVTASPRDNTPSSQARLGPDGIAYLRRTTMDLLRSWSLASST